MICITPIVGSEFVTASLHSLLSPINSIQNFIEITPLITVFVAFGLVLAFRAVFHGIQQPLVISLILSTTEPDEQGKAIGLRATANRITSIGTPIAMGAIADWLGLQYAFYVIGFIATAMILLMTLYIARHPEIHTSKFNN
jgi:sugar phosphate permease